ncbi:hypothetical protein PIB30_052973 [Stylosanthes scabra]|uniref:Uncharacterized protein n=1 Tax=Stylosanthes scabra TaxID=79078 RepID=A0ABU6TJ87_9FABA|nr:hypothetical protein [Stylosanthes scabra]
MSGEGSSGRKRTAPQNEPSEAAPQNAPAAAEEDGLQRLNRSWHIVGVLHTEVCLTKIAREGAGALASSMYLPYASTAGVAPLYPTGWLRACSAVTGLLL